MKKNISNRIKTTIVLLLIILITSIPTCFPYVISRYNYWSFYEISRMIKKHSTMIEDCYKKAITILNENNASLLYINESTITVIKESTIIANIDDNDQIKLDNNGITQSVFQLTRKIHGITVTENHIDFGGWGNLSASIGFIYSPKNEITIYDLASIENENEISDLGNAYYWEQMDGDNTAYLRCIDQNYYYYELWW